VSVKNYIDNSLLKEQEDKKDRDRSGKYSPSSFGRCYRLQWFNRRNEPITNPPDLKALRKMAQGTATHKLNQDRLPKEKCEILVETLDVKGFADIVDEIVYDIKSSEEWLVKKYWKRPTTFVIEDKYESFLQVAWYALELQKEFASILPLPFGTLIPYGIEHTIRVADWVDDIACELYHLRMYWDLGMPPALPRAYNGMECNYCSWKDKCKEIK